MHVNKKNQWPTLNSEESTVATCLLVTKQLRQIRASVSSLCRTEEASGFATQIEPRSAAKACLLGHVVRRISRSRQPVDIGSRKRLVGHDTCSALPTRVLFALRAKPFLRVDLARITGYSIVSMKASWPSVNWI